MTPVGHTLTGLALGVLTLPRRATGWHRTLHLAVYGALASVPDFPLPHWGHERYDISHSVFVNALLIGLCITLLAVWSTARQRAGGWSVVVGGGLAWLSHLLLDAFYNHGLGVAIFWPFSPARLVLPIVWFTTLPSLHPPLTWDVARIFAVEGLVYGGVLLGALGVRRFARPA